MRKKIAIVLFAVAVVLIVASMVLFGIYDARPFDAADFWIAYTASDLLFIAPALILVGIWLLLSPKKIHAACFASSLLCAVTAFSWLYFGLSPPELTGPQFIGVIYWAVVIACPVLFVAAILVLLLDLRPDVKRKNGVDIKLSNEKKNRIEE